MLKAQSTGLATRSQVFGTRLNVSSAVTTAPSRSLIPSVVCESPYGERFRLHNLTPQEGSRKKKTRKGRGYSAGKGGSCGFGMRGQKSRSGSGTRPGFEGGQTPLYRRIPKLRGIAGGMPAGRQKFVTVNLSTLAKTFEEGDVIDLATLKGKGIVNATGKERKLPLKVTPPVLTPPEIGVGAGPGRSAKSKIEEAGGTPTVVPLKPKWTQALYDQRVAEGLITPRKTKRYYYLQKKAAEEAKSGET